MQELLLEQEHDVQEVLLEQKQCPEHHPALVDGDQPPVDHKLGQAVRPLVAVPVEHQQQPPDVAEQQPVLDLYMTNFHYYIIFKFKSMTRKSN